jgi:hypothetical protein
MSEDSAPSTGPLFPQQPPHAFHVNLPPQTHRNHASTAQQPWITEFAHLKARSVVQLVHSIQLTPDLFWKDDRSGSSADDAMEDDGDDPPSATTEDSDDLSALLKKCGRLSSQITTLEGFKYGGWAPGELCDMVLHLLRLVTCTISYDKANSRNGDRSRTPVLHWEDVGHLRHVGDDAATAASAFDVASDEASLRRDLERPFALPTPARETLLSVLIHILSNKGPLRAVSNAALYTSTEPRLLLVLHWQVLLRMLLRTSPHLDERMCEHLHRDSTSRINTVQKRTVQLIRDARHFFAQGMHNNSPEAQDQTARQVWEMVRTDVLYHSHTHACYRGSILLYLFWPTRTSAAFYAQVLPEWFNAWTNIDRCPEYDFLWLALFCRARKHVTYDWSPLRQRLLTLAQYWLQLPIGGAALDQSFPRAPAPRSRSCPSRLKAFVGSSSSYEEGIDFVAKVAKLLVTSLGPSTDTAEGALSEGTLDLLRFLSFVTPYFHPSNVGSWTFTLGAFLHYFCYELCCRVGGAAGYVALQESHPDVARALEQLQPPALRTSLPARELAALLHALLPLCHQCLYSKNSHVGRAGEAAMLYLVQIDPVHTVPFFVDFSMRALDISAVNLAHQAPSALSALTRLIQPALRTNPSYFLSRLPDLLRLSLAGIDSNDQNKTIRTLILYRSLASWILIGGNHAPPVSPMTVEGDVSNGTLQVGRNLRAILSRTYQSEDYQSELDRLPANSFLKQSDTNELASMDILLEEMGIASGDWALEFLDRVFELLRASGEREKASSRRSGVASRHSSADVHQARNFSRVLKESLLQVFCAMDEQVFSLALRNTLRFLEEDTLPNAAKDASLLCQAVASARVVGSEASGYKGVSPGLDALLPVLLDDLKGQSTKTAIYRLRCLAGSLRLASYAVVEHKQAISEAIDFALASEDRHIFKTGCKVLRHTLSNLCESSPIAIDSKPSTFMDESANKPVFGKSAQLDGLPVQWHVPNSACIDFAWELIDKHMLKRINDLTCPLEDRPGRTRLLNACDVPELRRCLRVARYTLRGAATVFLDSSGFGGKVGEAVPHEAAGLNQLSLASDETKKAFLGIRDRLCSFVIVLQSIIASETLHPDGVDSLASDETYGKTLRVISSDAKVCKETSDIALLLLTRRGASFRSQEAMTVWKAQKQLSNDYMLCAQVDAIVEALQSAGLYAKDLAVLYKDGEDGGKCIPRRLLVTRVFLFHNSMIRNASFEIPRRLRREAKEQGVRKNTIFKAKTNLPDMLENLEGLLAASGNNSLDSYEGLIDGLYALSCNSSTQVRSSAISVIDYALTRFGWLLSARIPRLMAAISLDDKDENGKFGIPSCQMLLDKTNQQGKRKRLSEALKGALAALSIPRSIKLILGSHRLRLRFAQTICGTDSIISLMPTEEMQKMIHYVHAVFSPFRSKLYNLPRTSVDDEAAHKEILQFSVKLLYEKNPEVSNGDDSANESTKAVHWRKMLLACWFLVASVDRDDGRGDLDTTMSDIWETCLKLLETEVGQPLQQVALGLLGKLVHLYGVDDKLRQGLTSGPLVKVLSKAIMYDHKEDSKYSGGHDAQWSAGVEDIIRDSARFIAPRSLFPFQRTSQSTGTFKVSHCHLLQVILKEMGGATEMVVDGLLAEAKEMTLAPPNEDQRNQQVTSAEIFSGVCAYYMLVQDQSDVGEAWTAKLVPFLDDAMNKIPFSLSGAYVDALRYTLHFCPSGSSFGLTKWLVERIQGTLWQPIAASGGVTDAKANGGSSHGTEGFTSQSKWLFLVSAVLIEMEQEDMGAERIWYLWPLVTGDGESARREITSLAQKSAKESWGLITSTLLPRLIAAVGHPFDNCRDHIARCLFRICYCYRKRARMTASRAPSRVNSASALAGIVSSHDDPGTTIVERLLRLVDDETMGFIDRYNALSCGRKFLSYCVHYGEGKFEFKDYVVPLLPLAFRVLKSTVEEDILKNPSTTEESTLKRSTEADVIKAFRSSIADISVTSVVSYGSDLDIDIVLDEMESLSKDPTWQIRQACIHFLRCFQGAHKFLFNKEQAAKAMGLVSNLLADERREVSSAAMAALTGLLVASTIEEVSSLVQSYAKLAKKSTAKKKKTDTGSGTQSKEKSRSRDQQISVFFLCAAVMAQPYETPSYVPVALAAISRHSFERNAPLSVRDTVKKCCAEYKRTHMTDNWEEHRNVFSREQMEALDDVISTPHYYA